MIVFNLIALREVDQSDDAGRTECFLLPLAYSVDSPSSGTPCHICACL